MATSVQHSAGVPNGNRESMSQRLAAAARVILANGWAAQHQIDHAVAKAMSGSHDHDGVGRYLVDNQVITRDQASELEEVLKHQPHFPNYRLTRKLGSGGMGTVFLAEHLASGRKVAVKTMNARLEDDKDFIGRFQREAKALGKIKHPTIAEIIESGENKGHCWLAMEFIDGPSLMNLLKDYRVLPEAYALRICKQVAEGLGHVWSTAHLVHRDLKPENILVIRNRTDGGNLFPPDDQAKLIDFGLVKGEDKDDRLTQTGMTIGTPLYMSPEQVRGEKLDCRSDIYGLGATLYHLLTGFTPFTGTSPGSIMSAHLTEPVPDPGDRVPSLTKSTRELVKMSMAKDMGDRFLNFEAMVMAMETSLAECGTKGTGTLRLLRKPLVLNRPQTTKKVGSNTDRTVKGEEADSPRAGGSGSSVLAFNPEPGSKPSSSTLGSGKPRPSALEPTKPASSSFGLTKPPTSAYGAGKPPTPPLPLEKPAAPLPGERSKVFDEDPQSKLGIGILPWVVLAFAVVGLILYLLMAG